MLRIVFTVIFVFWFLLAMLGRALAADELVPAVSPLTERILAWVTVVMVIATLLAGVLPPHWRLTQVLARVAADTRGILIPDPRKTTKLPPLD